MSTLITVSYCADHTKGPQYHGYKLPAAEHAEMLLDTVRYLKSEVPGAKVCVCSSGGHPVLSNQGSIMDDVASNAEIIWESHNRGYSEGATMAIHQAIGMAKKFDCDTILHTCEDVVPHRGECRNVLSMLANIPAIGYVGERWRPNTEPLELSTQFFAAKVDSLKEWQYPSDMPPERQMGSIIRSWHQIGRVYEHTHSFSDFKSFMAEVRG